MGNGEWREEGGNREEGTGNRKNKNKNKGERFETLGRKKEFPT